MATIELNDVTKSFGAVNVIRGVSIDIPDGGFVALVGPSGCGKSTLLRMIAGLEPITGGHVRIGGRVVNDLPPKERNVSMVFQSYALYPHMNVEQNMGFSLSLRGAPAGEVKSRTTGAAATLGLGAMLDRFPKALSGGQRQRVAMGRAIVRKPEVFLFDEPLSNLDAKLRVAMRAELKALHRRLGTTSVYVTHDQIEAMTMADQIVVMRDGVVEQIGAPLDVYDTPSNVFVAGFIGSPAMNLIDGRVAGTEFITRSGARLPIGARPQLDGARLTLGIRPEHLHLAPDGLPGTVELVEPTGSEIHLTVRSGDDMVVLLLRERRRIALGDTVHLRASGEHLHLFATETGRRLG